MKARIRPRSSTPVLVEALVFRRDERLLNVLGNVGERDPDPALVLLEYLREAPALAVEHDAGAGQFHPPQLAVSGRSAAALL